LNTEAEREGRSPVFKPTTKNLYACGRIPVCVATEDSTFNYVVDQLYFLLYEGSGSSKVVSIFEPHTDIIIKDNRDTYYGHKICLTGGASNLILDCEILEGNPADVTLVEQMFENQKTIYDRYPSKVFLDGGFASADNLELTKGTMKIKDVCFAKKRAPL